MSKRRSNIHTRVTAAIPEDDHVSPQASSIGDTPNKALQEHQPLNLMSSTINESAASRSLLLDEMDKENLKSPDVPLGRPSPTKRSRHIVAQLVDDDPDGAYAAPALAARLDAIEAKVDERCADIEAKVNDLNWFVRFKLWTMEDTDLAMLRLGLAEVNETVSQLARSDPFIQQFEALKDENAMLRSQLRMARGNGDGGEREDGVVLKTLGHLG